MNNFMKHTNINVRIKIRRRADRMCKSRWLQYTAHKFDSCAKKLPLNVASLSGIKIKVSPHYTTSTQTTSGDIIHHCNRLEK